MTAIVYVTHSTSLDTERGLASGHFDVALSATGEQQARELGARYATEEFAAIYCSDLHRAFNTAAIAFPERAGTIVRDARLRECDYGALTRQPSVDVEQVRGRHVEQPFPGGESYRQVVERVRSLLEEIELQYPRGTVLLVGHRAPWFVLEHLLRGVPLAEAVTGPFDWQPGWRYPSAVPVARL